MRDFVAHPFRLSPDLGKIAMAYVLRGGLSCCAVEDRFVFLDLQSDRYFCLSSAIESEFRKLVEAPPVDGVALERLLPRSLLISHDWQHGIWQCDAPAATGETHGEPENITALDGLTAAALILRCRAHLKVRGLAKAIQHLIDRKAATGNDAPMSPAGPDVDGTLARVTGSFQMASRFIGTHKLCLPWSLAIAHRLISHRISPLLVLGVRLTPFAAHAWVQVDSTLIGERRERTDMFTPILVV
ncbi:lasso peptide biosynthesis B2 protein [Novosphingobium sp.]|uniref:lasso peptide biosynthesis B2 protein n=1 Tax=Novosphingobium sp. TaxID=1874826 RepID=UPI0028AC01D7|nr:lasso peptide biosynthesis B2 protein [Novosphingobium sp.]